mmetsp:Transcript_28063/g.64243  ORF Transcript_28063/g.64243 Transcript_28063/m.64243 type:complete len:213 (-) Transcript_28063:52-690(-)
MKDIERSVLNASSPPMRRTVPADAEDSERTARLRPKPRPKFDPVSGKWVVPNWDGSVWGVEGGENMRFDEIGRGSKTLSPTGPSRMAGKTTSATSGGVARRDDERAVAAPPPPPRPFARVDAVSDGSPAQLGGIKEGDLILTFGTANSSNHRKLSAIAEIVALAAGNTENVAVTVQRNGDTVGDNSGGPLRLRIQPRTWNGRGVLGCHIVPI